MIGEVAEQSFRCDGWDCFVPPKWGPLGEITYYTKYSRLIPATHYAPARKEGWHSTVSRVVGGAISILKNHCLAEHCDWDDGKADRAAYKMAKAICEFKFLPPGRGLWAMGTDHVLEHGGAALNNCGFVSTVGLENAPTHPFGWMMNAMMVGTGVGFDLAGGHKLQVRDTLDQPLDFVVEDSREGWVQSLQWLISSYVTGNAKLKFDYSAIRPRGTPLKTFGGVASGPEPLMQLHESVRKILHDRIGYLIRPIDILDIMNCIGVCVFAGNIRRGAQIALGSPSDADFVLAKTGVDGETPWRRASNNSVTVGMHHDYNWLGALSAQYGEPGYFWLDNARMYGRMKDGPNFADHLARGTNPCGEQTLEPFELCCLVETFMGRHNSLKEYLDTLKYAYLYAKAVTLVPTGDSQTNRVMARNRRIGCSQSGITRAFTKFGKQTVFQWSDIAYKFLTGLDEEYSAWLKVPTSIKKTTVKPSGTVSLLPGETPGIHYPHSRYYLRRQRIASNDPVLPALVDAGYVMEPDAFEHDKTMVVEFPVEEPLYDRGKADVSMWEQLENAAMMQYCWSDNQVSATVTVAPTERDEVRHGLELYAQRLKAISFLPIDPTEIYPQAPYEEIDEVEYTRRKALLKPLKLKGGNDAGGDMYCEGDVCSR